jgi:hypothetical protein
VPDPNKFKALEAAGFVIQETCQICQHWGGIESTVWGRCYALTYTHEKHSDERKMGTPLIGRCDEFELSDVKLFAVTQSYARLLPRAGDA